jgi:ribosomal protein S18 acetylase RimI-like enzyme
MSEATFEPMSEAHADALATLLAAQSPEYVAHFRPFPFDAGSLAERVNAANADRYWVLRWNGEVAGFFMIRGFDEGYARPAFGVFVGEAFANRGLGRMALSESIRSAKERGCRTIMLKVAPENVRAVTLYEGFGFLPVGRCERSGQTIMELSLQ